MTAPSLSLAGRMTGGENSFSSSEYVFITDHRHKNMTPKKEFVKCGPHFVEFVPYSLSHLSGLCFLTPFCMLLCLTMGNPSAGFSVVTMLSDRRKLQIYPETLYA